MNDQLPYDAIGTIATPATLTDDYADNTKTLVCKHLPDLHLDIQYIPKAGETNRYITIKIEVSNDEGTTFFERSLQTNTTAESKVYQETPFTFPGSKTSTGGATYKGYVDDKGVVGDKVKISVKEDSAGNHGTVYIGATLSNPE